MSAAYILKNVAEKFAGINRKNILKNFPRKELVSIVLLFSIVLSQNINKLFKKIEDR